MQERSSKLVAFFCTLLVALSILIPLSFPWVMRILELGNAPKCLGNMALVAKGFAPSILHCPESGESYRIDSADEGDLVACPSRRPHLAYEPRFVHGQDGWRFRIDLPDEARNRGVSTLVVRDGPDVLTVRQPFTFANVYLYLGAFMVVAVGGFFAHGAGTVDEFVRWLGNLISSRDRAAAVDALLFQIALRWQVWGLAMIFLWSGVAMLVPALRDRTVELSKQERSVTITDVYPFGLTRHHAVENVELFYPVNLKVQAFHRVEKELESMFLFGVGPRDLDVVRRMNEALPGMPWPPP